MIKWLDHHDSIKLNHSLEDVVHRINASISEQVNKKGIDRLFKTHGWWGSVSEQGGVLENGWSGNGGYSRMPSTHASVQLRFEEKEDGTIIHFSPVRTDKGIGPLILAGVFMALSLASLVSFWVKKGEIAWPALATVAVIIFLLHIYRLRIIAHVESCMSFIERLMKERSLI